MWILMTVAIILALIVWAAEKGAVNCPRCGTRMVWGVGGYDKYTCLNCGHSKR